MDILIVLSSSIKLLTNCRHNVFGSCLCVSSCKKGKAFGLKPPVFEIPGLLLSSETESCRLTRFPKTVYINALIALNQNKRLWDCREAFSLCMKGTQSVQGLFMIIQCKHHIAFER